MARGDGPATTSGAEEKPEEGEQWQAGPVTMARRLPASQLEQADSRSSAGRGGSGSG